MDDLGAYREELAKDRRMKKWLSFACAIALVLELAGGPWFSDRAIRYPLLAMMFLLVIEVGAIGRTIRVLDLMRAREGRPDPGRSGAESS